MECVSGYREVIPDQTKPEQWKEFTLNTGGTPSTLQDIKVQQRAGGYTYRTCPSRFIFWRTNHDVLELVEESLGVNLAWNHIKYRFKDTPILDGVTIHETYNSVIVLVSTVSSAHRLVFPHPDKLTSQGAVPEANIASVFSEATLSAARDPSTYHILTSSPNLPHTSASCLTKNGDALFALALGTGMVLLVHLEPLSGVVTCKELFQDTRVPRFLSGFSDVLLGRHAEDSVAVSMVLQSVNKTVYLFGVCRDGQLRVWNCDKGNFVIAHDVSEGAAKYAQGGQNHSIRKALGPHGELYLCVFLGFTNGSKLVVVSPKFETGIFKFYHITTVDVPEGHDLVEVWLGNQGGGGSGGGGGGGGLWCIWISAQGETAISHMPLPATEWLWTSVQPAPPLERNLNPMIDPRQAYLQAIFEPGLFSYADISRGF
ncbi:hypothetical protein LSTR_LSTR002135 [Laodelphax striatellus]|uniref:Nucleoporin Nup120/160 beta-propeller domain-containing protein n=1 Tax=Laodelphax striatellus TaxID=195883 RepID=A0A482XRI0_LAOST|nr:hypothetical protein LSTR_LSTR002135 [Laodelphax striatellus]